MHKLNRIFLVVFAITKCCVGRQYVMDVSGQPIGPSSSVKKYEIFLFFTTVPCSISILSKFFYLPTDAQYSCFKRILKFTLKRLLHVSVQSPSSESVLFELSKVIILINQLDATLCSLIYSLLRFTLHVSGAFCTHHQEYN
jgi:hypothetical protein